MWWLILFSFTISEAQTTDIAKARKLRSGSVVTVAGRVTVGNEFGDLSFIQDGTGGIAIYDALLERGDSVIVRGELAKFNGMIEIVADSVWKAGQKREVMPVDILARYAVDHEGQLVRIKGVSIKPPGHFFYPQRSGLLLTATDTLTYWIDGDTNIPGYSIPSATVSITGVIGRFKDNLQVLPRSIDDIPGIVPHLVTVDHNNLAIMNWNVEFFGAERYGPSNNELQLANAVKLLSEVKPDIVALQEVSNDIAFRELVKQLPGYEGRCSGRYSFSFDTSGDFPPQKLCFVYRKEVVKVIREKIMFQKLYDSRPDLAEIFSSGRLPWLLETDLTNNGIIERLSFVNYHGKSGAGLDDLARREFDARLLKDTIDRYYSGRRLMILGDFNDDVDVSIVAGRPSPYSDFKGFISKKLSDDNWHSTISYNDVIDHQFVSPGMEEDLVSIQIVNPFVLIPKYGQTTSDHLPVLSQFQWKKVTGIENESEMLIFPNPTTGNLNVMCEGRFEYTAYNITGIKIASGSATGSLMLDVPPGLYRLIINKGPISRAFTFIRSE